MNENIFITTLKKSLSLPLPGDKAHELLSPPARKKIREINLEELKPRLSAVMILIYHREGREHIVLIKRPEYEGVHSGQIALPGGKFENIDNTLENTALRETEEEIGINPKHIEVLGKLSDIYIPPSNFIVSPYVGYINEIPVFIPNKREVEAIHSLEISLLHQSNITTQRIVHNTGVQFSTPIYQINELRIWGATAMILSEFAMVVNSNKF